MRVLQNIKPTAEQLPILRDVGPGFRLIRGAAGSGKTTAAVMRLRQLCAARIARLSRLGLNGPVRVLVLTFNRTLRGYVEELAKQQASDDDVELIVETFSRWAMGLCPGGRASIIDRRTSQDLLRAAGFPSDSRYFEDEVQYLLGRFPRERRDEYLDATRSGRGRAPPMQKAVRAKLLSDVIEPYEEAKTRLGQMDWQDVARVAATAPSEQYDIVVVDEAQDLSANQVRCLLAHLSEDHTTTFVVDAVQRVYPQAFQWREVGISMRPGQVFTLGRNHRNTAAIARLAASLVKDLSAEEDGVVPDAGACAGEGARPRVLAGLYNAQLARMLDDIEPVLAVGDTVAILQPQGGRWFDFVRKALTERGLEYCELTRERDWPTGPEQIALSTIHSAKGLEFDHVLMPGLNQEVTPHGAEDGDGTLESLQRLVAMGIGRARKTVTLGYKPDDRSTLIELLDRETYDLLRLK
ncbi:MAG: AAA family ATPase [Gammaproteobacteria bacterium]|nr:AAA family ATPase [Gammaproteobacteria bacterium]